MILLIHTLQRRIVQSAGSAPRCPEVDNLHLSLHLAQRHHIALEVGQREVGSLASLRHLLHTLYALEHDASARRVLSALAHRVVQTACVGKVKLSHQRIAVVGIGSYDVVVLLQESLGLGIDALVERAQRVVGSAGAAELVGSTQSVITSLHGLSLGMKLSRTL